MLIYHAVRIHLWYIPTCVLFAEGLFDQYISQQDYKPVWTPIQSVSNSSKFRTGSSCYITASTPQVVGRSSFTVRAASATLNSPLHLVAS